MKRLFFLTLILLLDTIAVVAQDSWTVDENKYTGETIIYCSLQQETATDEFNPYNYNVAAFIDNDIRALGEYKRDNAGIYFIGIT